ncbi:glycosyltransferase [Streptomyces zhihengii]|uniref:glycosyltransferase n=1 Tax=Streptomyces zhihengii TaxID=1818004 RepID=UPI00362FBF4A
MPAAQPCEAADTAPLPPPPDPLAAARHAFFRRAHRLPDGPRPVGRPDAALGTRPGAALGTRPDARPDRTFDACAETRPDHAPDVDHGMDPDVDHGMDLDVDLGRERDRAGDLGVLLDAEYGPHPRALPAGPAAAPGRQDAVLASLRRACRLGAPLTPEALLAHASGGPRTLAVLTEMWPDTVRRHGRRRAERALRHLLLSGASDATGTAFLLDSAESADLAPLSAAEASRLTDTGDRAARHALWRYLHHVPGGTAHLPAPGAGSDPYERLLLAPPDIGHDDPGDVSGIVVAQAMLQGGLETPGQGSSGGLSVLLGGLGDRLASCAGIGRVLTIVTAGHDLLEHDRALLHRRRPGHWVLRLPVDSPAPPQPDTWPAHRAALTWWAHRLLRSLPFAVDIAHLRYGDDGSLALAEAASRTGARLFFTATPDPHRTLVRKYTEAGPHDPGRGELLRGELHRVFCADRLVDRADTVLGIPGRSGTRELLAHYPVLGDRYGPRGPAAPPEGIAPYTPARNEGPLRRRMLDDLFAGGDRPDALAPQDRPLPLLLCVGRLHPVKQQDLLVRTWLATELWRTTTLVVVGGGTARPTPSERRMREALGTLLRGHDAAGRRLAVLPALPNDAVRRLERALADPAGGVPAWYVCPSVKEEFGLAVLEAMEAGLPAAGPSRGGVPHYLRDGVNGLLLDTSSAAGLARGLHRLAAVPEDGRRRLALAGRETAVTRYSVADMADALAGQYRTTARRTVGPV